MRAMMGMAGVGNEDGDADLLEDEDDDAMAAINKQDRLMKKA